MAKKTINLKGYSKEDLMWIIKEMVKWHGDFYFERAIIELAHKKELDRIDEAKKYSDISSQKRQEYIDLLLPYEGRPIKDIPLEVLEKAEKAMKEAQAADRKWCKLMGIKEG